MKRIALAALLVVAPRVAISQQAVPEIRFDARADFLKLPPGMNFGEVAGVAVNSKRHFFRQPLRASLACSRRLK